MDVFYGVTAARWVSLRVLGGLEQLVLEKIRVVLVNTSHPGNIGAAARAMKNMGLHQLVLVNPKDFPSADAWARASGE